MGVVSPEKLQGNNIIINLWEDMQDQLVDYVEEKV